MKVNTRYVLVTIVSKDDLYGDSVPALDTLGHRNLEDDVYLDADDIHEYAEQYSNSAEQVDMVREYFLDEYSLNITLGWVQDLIIDAENLANR